MIQEIADALVQSWRNFASAFVLFVPRLVAATIIFAGGLVVSLIARRAVQRCSRSSPKRQMSRMGPTTPTTPPRRRRNNSRSVVTFYACETRRKRDRPFWIR